MNITIFTIVYNGYGRFLPQWVEYMRKQTVVPKMIVVLGKDHGADIDFLKENKVKIVEVDSANMGVLRNAGLREVKTEWWLYFSSDDELLPNACEYIINQEADAVSIKFDVIQPNGSLTPNCKSPCMNSIKDLQKWKQYWGGYVAIKGNHDLRFNENIEVPNLTMHFELFRRGLKTISSVSSLIVHHRWDGSHHFKSTATGKCKIFIDEIEKTKNEVIKEILMKRDEFKNKQGTLVEIMKGSYFTKEDKKCEKGDYLIIEDAERLQMLIEKGYVKII